MESSSTKRNWIEELQEPSFFTQFVAGVGLGGLVGFFGTSAANIWKVDLLEYSKATPEVKKQIDLTNRLKAWKFGRITAATTGAYVAGTALTASLRSKDDFYNTWGGAVASGFTLAAITSKPTAGAALTTSMIVLYTFTALTGGLHLQSDKEIKREDS